MNNNIISMSENATSSTRHRDGKFTDGEASK